MSLPKFIFRYFGCVVFHATKGPPVSASVVGAGLDVGFVWAGEGKGRWHITHAKLTGQGESVVMIWFAL